MKMTKKMKLTAVFGAACLLSAGASMTAMADWVQQGSDWMYLDGSGNRVTNEWRQSNGYYFYLDGNGIMARDQWIDDEYYVDINGVRVTDRWIYSEDGNDGAPDSDGGWFYVGSNGRVLSDEWATINGQRYRFDSDGSMMYGWYSDDNNLYYLGGPDDGAAKTGWLCLAYDPDEDDQDEGSVYETDESGYGTWFYFGTNGRAVRADEGDGYVSRNINGYRYYFDENGVMATGWASVADQAADDVTGISTLKYFGAPNQGQMAEGWVYLYDDPEDSDYNDNNFSFNTASASNASRSDWGDGAWYYFDSNGVPAYLESDAATLTDATTRVNGERFCFDEYGRMQSGLLGIQLADGTVVSAYFGADDSDGAMKTGRVTNVVEEDGEISTFYFTTTTGGQTGVRNNYLYSNGKLVQAEDGEGYQVFEVNGTLYLVNESGRVQDSNRTYRVDGEYRYEYDNGTIYYINDDRERLGRVTSGSRAPYIAFEAIYQLSGQTQ